MVRFRIQGLQPERALLRLKRAKIGVYSIKKPQKDQLIFSVKKQDEEKIFAIYPKTCYNKNGYSPFSAEKIGEYGLSALIQTAKTRLGCIVGALLFCVITLFSDNLVFGVKITGTQAYTREVYLALADKGITPFSVYEKGREDEICATLLRLPSVEFCSVKKQGLYLQVELRLSEFLVPTLTAGDMLSSHTGVVTAITVAKGTALKKVGDTVEKGEPLVGGYILTPSEKKQDTHPVARVQIACVYEAEYSVETEEQAFAKAYLEVALSENTKIYEKAVVKTEKGYFVRLSYTAIQSVNL